MSTGTISGTVNRERVILVHKDAHAPVFETTPDPVTGAWSIEGVPLETPMMAIYLKDECQPEIHGPYWAEAE
jgi:hypothetical protein